MDVSWLVDVRVPVAELVLRGTLMYWFLLLVFRFVLRRDAGSLGVADILFLVLVADASQNAMAGGYDTVAEGVILLSTLVGWNYLLDWASYHWPWVQKLTEAPPLLLVKNGRMQHRNMRKEFLTPEDIEAQLRQAGVADIREVREAYLEGDGKFSVLTRKTPRHPKAVDDGGLPGA
jgi:uncharacterized membrane protein YcaP (DUF421 family)